MFVNGLGYDFCHLWKSNDFQRWQILNRYYFIVFKLVKTNYKSLSANLTTLLDQNNGRTGKALFAVTPRFGINI